MTRFLLGLAISLAVGAVVGFAGLGRSLGFEERLLPPTLPESWAALPDAGRVDVTLVSSEGLVRALGDGLSSTQIAMQRPGALALVDGRVFTVSGASTRQLLRQLSWDGLPIDARSATDEETLRFAAPAPASLGWFGRQRAYAALKATRELCASQPAALAAALLTALVLLVHAFASRLPARRVRDPLDAAPSPWRRRRAELPVRVVLVSDLDTLHQVRVAIGEEHVVASTEHAFAFADGWILAVRKGSVFELVSELGWRMRPLEMATRQELVGEGHALSPLPGDDAADALDLLEALHVCGPVAHGSVPRVASSALSPA